MGRIKRIDAAGYFSHWELDDIPLEDGEKLVAAWPDGATQDVIVRLRNGPFPDAGAARLEFGHHGATGYAVIAGAASATRRANKCNCKDGSCPVCQVAWEKAEASARAARARRKARAAEEARKAAEASAEAEAQAAEQARAEAAWKKARTPARKKARR